MDWERFAQALSHFSASQRQRISEAFHMAQKAHAHQKRKSGEPYVTHPIAVATILVGMGADADTLIAALLHDTVEDTPVTLDDIERTFGGTVRELIDGVTKLERADIGEKPTLDEQIETVRKMFTLMQKDVRIMVIKLADRLHNMQTVEHLPPERQTMLARETMDIYVRIADRLCMYEVGQELEALCTAILEPELAAQLMRLRRESDERAESIARSMESQLHEAFPQMMDQTDALPERKSWRRLRQQLQNEGVAATGISGVTVVFVCEDIDACYRVFGALHQLWKRETLSFQDFINAPQINGYQGLHTTVILGDGTRVRCKIRTEDMHVYALQGITTMCFDSPGELAHQKNKGILELLPWTKRIAPLAEDTKDRSSEFWDSLQSDILGETIVIHGPSDEVAHLPAGSTALDGAFYLFHDLALRISAIKVNGRDVPFQTLLKHGDALHVTLADGQTVERDWLQWTKSGVATAQIRSALAAGQSDSDKLATGRAMLQNVFTEHKKGFIEEFEEKTLTQHLSSIGLSSMHETYIAIADGYMDATTVFNALFGLSDTQDDRTFCTIRYAIDMNDFSAMDAVNTIHRSYALSLRDVHYRRSTVDGMGTVTIHAKLTQQQKDTLVAALKSHGLTDIRSSEGRFFFFAPKLVCMLILWGLDPVFSKIFLLQSIAPTGFTMIRAVSIFLFSLVILHWTKRPQTFSRITLTAPSLWLASIMFFLISLLTYLALDIGSPVLYNTVLRGNAVILTTPVLVMQGSFASLGVSLLLTITGMAILFFSQTPAAFFISLGVLLCFSTYTIASRTFQRRTHVLARYPQFFAIISGVSALLSIITFVLFPSVLPSFSMIIGIAAYCAGFIGIPYILFYTLTRDIGYPAVSPWINVSLLITFIAQAAAFGIGGMPLIMAAAILLTAGSFLAARNVSQTSV